MPTDNEKTPSKKKRAPAKKKSIASNVLPQPLKRFGVTEHPQLGIARSVSTASIIMTGLVIILAPNSVWILGPVIGAMAIFGIAIGYFASK